MELPETDRSPPNQPPSPRLSLAGAQRKVAIAVDLSDESAYAVRWSIQNYIRPGDTVILLHVRPTTVLYGADWGAVGKRHPGDDRSDEQVEFDFDELTASKAKDLAEPLVEARIPYKIHIVKDRDLKERLCLEVERLGLSAMIMGSRGFGSSKAMKPGKFGRLGTVSDYCVRHCICPVMVVRFPATEEDGDEGLGGAEAENGAEETELDPVPEEDDEYHDASDQDCKGD